MLSKSDYDITEAIRLFNKYSVEATFIVPTTVGLGKSIMDATSALRSYLKAKSIHDYEGQTQGPEGKSTVPAFLVTETNLLPTTASLYRPKAKGKEGDPRIWFSRLSSYASPNNLLCVIAVDGSLYVVNISNPKIRLSADDQHSPLGRLLTGTGSRQSSVVDELLEKLRGVASRGWIQTVTSGDTGVGATLESCLGIQRNSSRKPDYKGIELKTKRTTKLKDKTRSTLFAKVADWDISRLKSSAEILDKFGYFRNAAQRLNCTVGAYAPNSQGLMLVVDESKDLLNEIHVSGDNTEAVVSWRFEVLRNRLLEKHSETFWIGAAANKIQGVEYFHYKKALYTRNPFTSVFHTLCDQGVITVDHLIDGPPAHERGPLFKIKPSNLELLFPPPIEFDLS